jgi:hypothetical protein
MSDGRVLPYIQNADATMLPMADKSKNFNRAVVELAPERLGDELGEAVPDACEDFEDLSNAAVDEGLVEDVMVL